MFRSKIYIVTRGTDHRVIAKFLISIHCSSIQVRSIISDHLILLLITEDILAVHTNSLRGLYFHLEIKFMNPSLEVGIKSCEDTPRMLSMYLKFTKGSLIYKDHPRRINRKASGNIQS